MLLRYNGIDLLPGSTQEFSIRPLRDPTGLDSTWTEVTIATTCTWNPRMVASNKPAGAPLGYESLGVAGDNIGVTLLNLREKLMEPRKPLIVDLGPDRIFRVPRPDKNGVQIFPCDPQGGPFPEDCRVLAISGDKTATVLYRIRFAFSDCDRIVVSHRWSSSGSVDEAFRTTRTVDGRAILRLDMLEGAFPNRLVADQFRAAFAHPLPLGMTRKNIRIQVLPDGKELTYSFEDKEQERNLGQNCPAYKVEGHCTAGADMPIQSLKAIIEGAAGAAKDAADKAFKMDFFGSISASLGFWWKNFISVPKENAIVRVFGLPGASRSELIRIAVDVIVDRFGSISAGILEKKLMPVSFYITQGVGNEDPPFIELRVELLPLSLPGLAAMFSPVEANKLMIYDKDIVGGAGGAAAYPMKTDPALGNPVPPLSKGSRGRWAGKLIGQILATGCLPPAPPPAAPDPRSILIAPDTV